jgi:hypothetical protein
MGGPGLSLALALGNMLRRMRECGLVPDDSLPA